MQESISYASCVQRKQDSGRSMNEQIDDGGRMKHAMRITYKNRMRPKQRELFGFFWELWLSNHFIFIFANDFSLKMAMYVSANHDSVARSSGARNKWSCLMVLSRSSIYLSFHHCSVAIGVLYAAINSVNSVSDKMSLCILGNYQYLLTLYK